MRLAESHLRQASENIKRESPIAPKSPFSCEKSVGLSVATPLLITIIAPLVTTTPYDSAP